MLLSNAGYSMDGCKLLLSLWLVFGLVSSSESKFIVSGWRGSMLLDDKFGLSSSSSSSGTNKASSLDSSDLICVLSRSLRESEGTKKRFFATMVH